VLSVAAASAHISQKNYYYCIQYEFIYFLMAKKLCQINIVSVSKINLISKITRMSYNFLYLYL